MIGRFLGVKPKVSKTAFIAPGCILIGAAQVGRYSSVWYGSVVRADINKIRIGDYSNIQDGSILHVSDEMAVDVGDYVTVGHGAMLHACRIRDGVLIGMRAVVLNGAEIGRGCVVAAGAVVCQNFRAPAHSLIRGIPAKVVRKLTERERKKNIYWAEKYSKLSQEYIKRGEHDGKKEDTDYRR